MNRRHGMLNLDASCRRAALQCLASFVALLALGCSEGGSTPTVPAPRYASPLVSHIGRSDTGERIPGKVWTVVRELEMPKKDLTLSQIRQWAANTRLYPATSLAEDPGTGDRYYVVAYVPTSGVTLWNVHVFKEVAQNKFGQVMFIHGLMFKNSGTRMKTARVTGSTLFLDGEDGVGLVGYDLPNHSKE